MLTSSRASRAHRSAERSTGAVHLDPSTVFAGLEQADGLLLAVSGGADSMALLLLAARWAACLGTTAPKLNVATVDHGLRAESAAEAALVARTADGLGLPHAILHWAGPKPATRVQERARDARYALLAAHARVVRATHILTAHHADDQAETVMLRLTRGSGLSGLAGMRRETQLARDLRLVRPLLDYPKSDLVGLCRSEAQPWVEDPSNFDSTYARVRLRAHAETMRRLGLDRPGLLRLSCRLARADAALEAATDRLERRLDPHCEKGTYRADWTGMEDVEPELLLRLLRRAVAVVAGDNRHIRLDRLETLTDAIRAALQDHRPHRATLGGTRIVFGRDAWLEVSPEPARSRGRPQNMHEISL